MSKLLQLLETKLTQIDEKIEKQTALREGAEEQLQQAKNMIEEVDNELLLLESEKEDISAQVEAYKEDIEVAKVAVKAFYEGLEGDETKSRFQELTKAIGIELEIEADENESENEGREEATEGIVQIAN